MKSWRVLMDGEDLGIIETNWAWAIQYWTRRPNCKLVKNT